MPLRPLFQKKILNFEFSNFLSSLCNNRLLYGVYYHYQWSQISVSFSRDFISNVLVLFALARCHTRFQRALSLKTRVAQLGINNNWLTFSRQDQERWDESGDPETVGETRNRQKRDHQQKVAQSSENPGENGQSKYLQRYCSRWTRKS